MRVRLTALIAALLVACGGLLVPSPASAADGSISVRSGIFYDDCQKVPYSLSLSLPYAYGGWSLTVDAIGPDGLVADSDFLIDDRSGEFALCTYSGAFEGKYTLRVSGSWYDADYNDYPVNVSPASFTMRKSRSRVTVKASDLTPHKREVVRFSIAISDERPAGYFATPYADFMMQTLKRGRWVKIATPDTWVKENGRVTFRMRYMGKPKKIRISVPSDGHIGGSTSRVLRFRTGR